MHFQKEDLSCTHYQLEDASRQSFSGEPSGRLFDRFNIQQVLFMINVYASWYKRFTIEDGQSVEWQIANQLPVEAKSELSVFNWIRNSALKPLPSIF